MEPDWLYRLIAALCYNPHGGSGFSFTRADVLDMDLDEARHHLAWLDEQRSRESSAIRAATRKRRR